MASTAIYNTHGTSGGTVNNVNGSLTFQGDYHNIQGDQNNIHGNNQTIYGNYIHGNNQTNRGNNIHGNTQTIQNDNIHGNNQTNHGDSIYGNNQAIRGNNIHGDYRNIHEEMGTPGTKSEEAPKALQGTRIDGRTGSSSPKVSADSTSWPSAAAKIPDPPISLRPQSPPSALRTVQPLEQLVEEVLSLAPVPRLKQIWGPFKYIWVNIQRAQASAGQLRALMRSIAQLLGALYEQNRRGDFKDSDSAPLDDLHGVLEDIGQFLCKLRANSEPLKLLLSKGDRIARIDVCQCKILACACAFQISQLFDMEGVKTASDDGRAADQKALYEQFDAMEKDTGQLEKGLDIQPGNMKAMTMSIRQYLKHEPHVGEDRERQFFECVAMHLSCAIGRARTPENDTRDWMVSKYDVEFEQEPIGSGGFAQVLIGRWESKEVAVKMFQSKEGVAPQPQVVREEIETWSKLRHPNVLEFLAANVSDERPFVVMSYMKNGNARNYLKSHSTSDRIKLLHDASLGLRYLHQSGIVHGDIKAANILIDDAGRAVIADFGLSRVKTAIAGSTSRHIGKSTARKSTAQGSQYWMAPELFQGERPGFPCDVYSFGMTIYEILTGEVPLGHIDPDELLAAIRGPWGARPQRPSGIPEGDQAWDLAVDCWQWSASHRPSAGDICEQLTHPMANVKISRNEPVRRQSAPNPFRRNWQSETSHLNS